ESRHRFSNRLTEIVADEIEDEAPEVCDRQLSGALAGDGAEETAVLEHMLDQPAQPPWRGPEVLAQVVEAAEQHRFLAGEVRVERRASDVGVIADVEHADVVPTALLHECEQRVAQG